MDWTFAGTFFVGSGYQNGAVSGTSVAYNRNGNPAAASDGSFTFNGADLTGAWNDGLNITVTGLLADNPIYSQTVVVNTTGPRFFNFNYVGIDTVTFNSFGGAPHPNLPGGGTQFAMDNFTINEVPEPSSIALFGISVVALSFVIHRARRPRANIRQRQVAPTTAFCLPV